MVSLHEGQGLPSSGLLTPERTLTPQLVREVASERKAVAHRVSHPTLSVVRLSLAITEVLPVSGEHPVVGNGVLNNSDTDTASVSTVIDGDNPESRVVFKGRQSDCLGRILLREYGD